MPTTEEGWAELENELREKRPTEERSAIEDSIAYKLSLISEESGLGQRMAAMQREWTALSNGHVDAEEKMLRAAQLEPEAQALLTTFKKDVKANAVSLAELEVDFSRLHMEHEPPTQSAACALVIQTAISEAIRFQETLTQGVASCQTCIDFCATVMTEAFAEA